MRRVHFSAMARPSWLRRAVRNDDHHAIEQASRRWRGGQRDASARTRRNILISTQVKMSYKIGEGDYDVRKKRADKFIKNGNRVKLSIQFRGREQQHMSLGDDLIARFIDDLEEAGANIAKTKTIREGRDLTTILSQKS
mgnify:CR=1 FL=1